MFSYHMAINLSELSSNLSPVPVLLVELQTLIYMGRNASVPKDCQLTLSLIVICRRHKIKNGAESGRADQSVLIFSGWC